MARTPIVAALCLLALTAWPRLARADLRGSLHLEVQADASLEERSAGGIEATAELGLEADLGGGWSIGGRWIAEPLSDAQPDGPALFGEPGVYAEALTLRWRGERTALVAGKFTVPFGRAWDAATGLHATDFAEDYELSERIGAAGSLGLGEHRLTASLFALDTTPLAGAWPRNRPQPRRGDGGPGNTGWPRSGTLTIEGPLFRQQGLRYAASLLHQAQGERDRASEQGATVALEFARAWRGRRSLAAIAELASIWGAGGEPGWTGIATASTEGRIGPWLGSAGGALRRHSRAGHDDVLVHASLGYRFASGTVLEMGWRGTWEAGASSLGPALRLTRRFEF